MAIILGYRCYKKKGNPMSYDVLNSKNQYITHTLIAANNQCSEALYL